VATIFVSHSSYDTDIINFVNKAFAGASVKAAYMEFENLPAYPGKYIAQKIVDYDTQALFVLIGPNIDRNQYTSNWVAYEVGLATAMNKHIWVLETFEDNYYNRKNFPIPYVDRLSLYQLENRQHLIYLRDIIIARYGRNILETVLGPIPFQGYAVKCTNRSCLAEFALFSEVNGLHCPVCRQSIAYRSPNYKESSGDFRSV